MAFWQIKLSVSLKWNKRPYVAFKKCGNRSSFLLLLNQISILLDRRCSESMEATSRRVWSSKQIEV